MGLEITIIEFEDTPPSIDDVISIAENISGLEIQKRKSKSIVFSKYPNEPVNYSVNGNRIELIIVMGQFSLLRNLLAVALVTKGGINLQNPELNEINYEYWRTIGIYELRIFHFKNRLKTTLISLPVIAVYSIPLLIVGYGFYVITTWLIK